MALQQIQMPGRRQEETTLDKIAKGLGIAQAVMGTALAIPKFIQEREDLKKRFRLEERKVVAAEKSAGQISPTEARASRELGPTQPAAKSLYESLFPGQPVPETQGETMGLVRAAQQRQTITPYQQQQIAFKGEEMSLKREEAARRREKEASMPDLTPGQKALDAAYAKRYDEYVAGGGSAEAQKQLNQLNAAMKVFETGKVDISGPWVGALGYLGADKLLAPEAVEVKDSIEQAVLGSLRATLGAQFTEKEGTRVLQKTFNQYLPEEQNRQRLERLLGSLAARAKANERSAEYWEQNGTLKGFKGQRDIQTADDLMNYAGIGDAAKEVTKAEKESAKTVIVDMGGQRYEIPKEDLAEALKSGARLVE